MLGRMCRGTTLVLAALTLSGCANQHQERDQAAQIEVAQKAASSHPNDTSVSLVLDPGECFTCNDVISSWLRWSQVDSGRSLRVVLTRQPTFRERQFIARARLWDYVEVIPEERRFDPRLIILEGTVVTRVTSRRDDFRKVSTQMVGSTP